VSGALVTAVATGAGTERRAFLFALATVTTLPVFALTLARALALPAIDQFNFGLAFIATGFHVALTPFFYIEPELEQLRRRHPVRFLWAPLALCASAAVLVAVFHGALGWLLVFYFAWQLYHFQRQNVGVLAFVATGLKVARSTRLEQVAIELAAFAGICGFLSIDGVPMRSLGAFAGTLRSIGALAQSVALAIALGAWIIRLRGEGWSWFGPWHLLGTLFFAGTFVVPDLTFAYAHGLQYLLFMYLLSVSRGRSVTRLSPVPLTLVGLAGALVLTAMSNRELFGWSRDVIFAVYLGLVMSHFVVDALVWRLSEPTQRGYVRRAFAFVWD
jgi:hypothetical protein